MGNTKNSRDFLNSLAERQENTDITDLFDDVRETYGLAHIVYHATNIKGLTDDEPYLRLTYPDDWVSRYFEKNYFALDPVVEAGNESQFPFNWNRLDWKSRQRRNFLGDAAEHKVGMSGMSIPIHGPGGQHAILSVTSFMLEREWDLFLRSYMGDFQRVASYVHQAILESEGVEKPSSKPSLSPREIEVLQLCANGMNTDSIADALGVKERTIRAFIETARYKLNALNRIHAVAKAIGHGLIHPPS